MSASRSIDPEGSAPKVVSLAESQTDASCVSSSLMAFFSPSGDFRIETDFKNPQERAALILHLELAIVRIRQAIDNETNCSWSLAARVAA
jgi:hypothetical protein